MTNNTNTPPPQKLLVGRIEELEAQNERLREALELIADTDIKPFRCAAIARDALAAEDRTSREELLLGKDRATVAAALASTEGTE